VLTLLVNGSTAGILVKRLGLAEESPRKETVVYLARLELHEGAKALYASQFLDAVLGSSDYASVRERVQALIFPGEAPAAARASFGAVQSATDASRERDLRARFLQALRNEYWNQLEHGQSSAAQAQVLIESVDASLDDGPETPLRDWEHLLRDLQPGSFQRLRTWLIDRVPSPLNAWLRRLGRALSLGHTQQLLLACAVLHIDAHDAVVENLAQVAGLARADVLTESAEGCRQARMMLRAAAADFSELVSAVQSERVCRRLLLWQHRHIKQFAQTALLQEGELEQLELELSRDEKRMRRSPPHPLKLSTAALVRQTPLSVELTRLQLPKLRETLEASTRHDLRPGQPLVEVGQRAQGFWIVGRGVVRCRWTEEGGGEPQTIEELFGARSHRYGWAVGLYEVLRHATSVSTVAEDAEMQMPHTVSGYAETRVTAFYVPLTLLRSLLTDAGDAREQLERFLWRHVAGWLLHAPLRADVARELGGVRPSALRVLIDRGSVVKVTAGADLLTDSERENPPILLVLLKGRIFCRERGVVTAPALLTPHTLSSAAVSTDSSTAVAGDRLARLSRPFRFREDGSVRPSAEPAGGGGDACSDACLRWTSLDDVVLLRNVDDAESSTPLMLHSSTSAGRRPLMHPTALLRRSTSIRQPPSDLLLGYSSADGGGGEAASPREWATLTAKEAVELASAAREAAASVDGVDGAETAGEASEGSSLQAATLHRASSKMRLELAGAGADADAAATNERTPVCTHTFDATYGRKVALELAQAKDDSRL